MLYPWTERRASPHCVKGLFNRPTLTDSLPIFTDFSDFLLIFWDWLAGNLLLYFYILPCGYYYFARDLFPRFVESRNYKIQIVAHVGGKSAALLSGILEASYSQFFIRIDFNCWTIETLPDKKTRVGSLHDPWEYDGRLPPDAGYYPNLVIPLQDEPRKKNTCM